MIAVFGDARLPERFWVKVLPEPTSGCWLWTASADPAGYGHMSVRRRLIGAHRLSYMALVGGIAPDLQIDHRCRTPSCVNPAHLEVVTRLENVRRGLKGRLTTRCPRGHAYEGNVYVVKTGPRAGKRRCRDCHLADDRARYRLESTRTTA